jgi:glutaredoxin
MVIYGDSQVCSGCTMLKEYLDRKGFEYEFKDLATKENKVRIQYKRELKQWGVNHIPMALIDGDVVVGYDDIVSYLEK